MEIIDHPKHINLQFFTSFKLNYFLYTLHTASNIFYLPIYITYSISQQQQVGIFRKELHKYFAK